MLALGLTPKANEQGYEPEWLTSGLAFVDQDIVGQLIDTKQWQHAFGIAYNAESEPQGRSFPYAAYKQMRPERRAGLRRRGDLLPDVPAGHRPPDGRARTSRPQTFEAGHVRLPRRHRPARPLGLRRRATTRRPTTSARSGGTRTGSPARTTSPARGCSSTAARRYTPANVPDGPGRPTSRRAECRQSTATTDARARLRERARRTSTSPAGFGPLVVGAVLFVLMVLLAPTVAPEQRGRATGQRRADDHRRTDDDRPTARPRRRRRRRDRASARVRTHRPTPDRRSALVVAYSRPLLGARLARCPTRCRGASSPRA